MHQIIIQPKITPRLPKQVHPQVHRNKQYPRIKRKVPLVALQHNELRNKEKQRYPDPLHKMPLHELFREEWAFLQEVVEIGSIPPVGEQLAVLELEELADAREDALVDQVEEGSAQVERGGDELEHEF